ncbi:MAG TPA: hypothetical protein VJ752_22180 [Burkholderiaceae bacterium]|nr:hypothetical protein [Burkholderiaceae bacterium]
MAWTDTFVMQAKRVKPTGGKYTGGERTYLLILPCGKYWRTD